MADEKQSMEGGITPTVIQPTPIPVLSSTLTNAMGGMPDVSNTGSDVLDPTTIPNRDIPILPIAGDVISSSLDTQSNKILGNFSFGNVGALRIGEFQQGISGEIDISPNGIVAKNINNQTTFTLDGTTGNATFRGTLIAGNIITGAVQIINGGSITDANNNAITDSVGVSSINQFPNGSAVQGSTQSTTSTSFQDIPGTTINFSLARAANVLIIYSNAGENANIANNSDNVITRLLVDGSEPSGAPELYTPGSLQGQAPTLYIQPTTGAAAIVVQLGAGSHQLKLQFKSQNGGTAYIAYADIAYTTLGK